jgi:hypothetical protein
MTNRREVTTDEKWRWDYNGWEMELRLQRTEWAGRLDLKVVYKRPGVKTVGLRIHRHCREFKMKPFRLQQEIPVQ